MLGYLELRALFRYRSYQPWLAGAVFVALFVVAHVYGAGSPGALMSWTLLAVTLFGAVAIAVFLEQALRGRPLPAVLGALFTLGGALYLGFFFGFLIDLWLADDAATRGWLGMLPVWLILALVPTWAADVAAYLVGARIGRRKIAPRISPGKTWEGTLAASVPPRPSRCSSRHRLASRPGRRCSWPSHRTVGFASDLLESAIKRAAGAKARNAAAGTRRRPGPDRQPDPRRARGRVRPLARARCIS